MDLSTVNNIASFSNNKELKRAVDLTIDHQYPIDNLRLARTKYGKKILADLGEIQIFLPGRLTEPLKPMIADFNRGGYALVLKSIKIILDKPSAVLEFIKM